jgi:hypothetical protein
MSEHTHHHDDSCTCGCHEEEHSHQHGAEPEAPDFGVIDVETHLHDEACVVSGRLALRGDETGVKAELQAQLGALGRAFHAMGGIVGHIKASCETTVVDVYSVTDVEATSKRSPEAVMRIKLAAIIFAVEPMVAESMVSHALQKVRDSPPA